MEAGLLRRAQACHWPGMVGLSQVLLQHCISRYVCKLKDFVTVTNRPDDHQNHSSVKLQQATA